MKQWYLLYCKRSEQERAIVHLSRQDVISYYPKVSVEKIRRGIKSIQLEPLLPSYLFIYFDPESITFTTVRSTRGVSNFVCIGKNPHVVPQKIITSIQENEDTFAQREKLKDVYVEGDALELTQGEYQGLDAIFKESDGEKRSFLFINILDKHLEVSVNNTSIRRKL